MLPDFPKLKSQLNRRLQTAFKMAVAVRAPLVAQVRSIGQHEGKGGSFETEEGDIKQIDLKKVTASVESPISSLPPFTFEEALQKLMEAAEIMASKKTEMLFSKVTEAVEEVGNTVDAGGQPISAELILKVWETMQFNFDEQGNPRMPSLIFNPIQEQRVKEEFRRLETEPELIKRRQEIINRHKLDWYDRESNRKLVD